MIVGNNPNRETIRCIIDIDPAELEELISCCDEWEEMGNLSPYEVKHLRTISRTLQAIRWCRNNLPENKGGEIAAPPPGYKYYE